MKIDWYWAGFLIAMVLCLILEGGGAWIMVGWFVGIVFAFLDDLQFRQKTLTELEDLQERIEELTK